MLKVRENSHPKEKLRITENPISTSFVAQLVYREGNREATEIAH